MWPRVRLRQSRLQQRKCDIVVLQSHLSNMRVSVQLKQIASVVMGALVVALIVGFFTSPVDTLKWLGAPLLVLPSVLGITPTAKPEEIQTVSLYQDSPVVTVERAGQYAIYTDDRNVLSRANMLEGTGASWITAQLTPTGVVEISGAPVLRGARPYDPVSVRGRPILTFNLPDAGHYVLSFSPQSGTVYFAPDDVTGREAAIVIAMAAQIIAIAIAVLLVRWPQLQRAEQQRRQLAGKLAQKRVKDQKFWQDRQRDDTQV